MHSIILNSFILLNNCSYGYWDNIGKKCTNVCGNGHWNQNIQNCICDFGWSQNILNIDNYTKNKLYENPKLYLECTYYNNCNHGIWDINKKKCICYKNWRNYNIFDIISKEIYNDTKCEQFNCVSDNQCKKLLNNNDAKCIIKHQDCYCGLKYALKNKWMGYKNNNASCMSLLYIINFKLIFIIEYILSYGWYYTLCLSSIFIIFGQIRIRCPHNNKSIFNLLYCRIKDPCQCIYNKKKCPDNLWGGLFGMIIGTHKYCNLFYKYNQNNKYWFYECLALHKYDNILYNDDDFRNLISNFIESEQKYKPIEQII